MDSDIGGILRILRKRDAQKNSLFCVRFRTQNKLFFCAGCWLLGLTDFYKNISKGQSCEPF